MRVKSALKLTILGLAGYGGYILWNQYRQLGARVDNEQREGGGPSERRIYERSELSVEESAVGSDDPVAQATAILTDSDERSRLPRAAAGIERRQSQHTVEPYAPSAQVHLPTKRSRITTGPVPRQSQAKQDTMKTNDAPGLMPSEVSQRVGPFDLFAGWSSRIASRAAFFTFCVLLIAVWAPTIFVRQT